MFYPNLVIRPTPNIVKFENTVRNGWFKAVPDTVWTAKKSQFSIFFSTTKIQGPYKCIYSCPLQASLFNIYIFGWCFRSKARSQDVFPKDSRTSWNHQEEGSEGDQQCLRHVQPGPDPGVQGGIQYDRPQPGWFY